MSVMSISYDKIIDKEKFNEHLRLKIAGTSQI